VAATVVLTFDNLGTAGGADPAVDVGLARILGLLDELGLRATFCVEGVNAELRPDVLLDLHRRGHEVAHHAWRHERWAELPPAREEELLRRGREALERLGLPVCGFRPPGGEPTPRTLDLLAAAGFDWWSPLGERAVVERGVALLPFRWPLVDAFYLHEPFGGLRGRKPPFGPLEYERRILTELEAAVPASPVVLIFHPFLAVDDAAWAATARVLRALPALAVIATAAEVAERKKSAPPGSLQ
jgi:peptidoglycan/xylan/chitin deacetylase (PgdA/CDA1 family)